MKHVVKALLVCAALFFAFPTICPADDLIQSLAEAKQTNKNLFIIFSRDACGHCQHLKEMIKDGSVKISSSAFIIADINNDDKTQSAAFYKWYPIRGSSLPFVVIAKPDGAMISFRTGAGEAEEFNKLIQNVKN